MVRPSRCERTLGPELETLIETPSPCPFAVDWLLLILGARSGIAGVLLKGEPT